LIIRPDLNLWFNHPEMRKLLLLFVLSLFWLAACRPADPTRPPTRTPTLAAARPSLPAATEQATDVAEPFDPAGSETPAAAPTATITPPVSPAPTVDPLACLPDDPGETGLVSWVVDGKTFVIDQSGKRQTVRLLGVEALPLTEQTTRSLIDRQVVRLVPDGRNADRYGRLLRYVLLLDGRFVNDELLRGGVARLDPDVRGLACMTQFAAAEKYAIQEGLGAWAMAAMAELPPPTAGLSPTVAGSPLPASPTTTATVVATSAGQTLQPPDTPVIPTLPEQPIPPAPTMTPTATRSPTTGTPSPTGVQIVNIFYDGVKGVSEPDEYIEIKNFGTTPVDMSYWLINAEAYELWYIFPDFIIQPGQTCRVYSNEVNPDSCAGDSFLDSLDDWEVWDNTGDCGYLFNYTDQNPVSTKCYGQ
jgi:endonuclease YncB( thermonuclease family)